MLGGAILVLALAATVHTWTVFSQVIDEPCHVAAGVEWLDTGHFELHPHGRLTASSPHPPLARILFGIGPMLRGARDPALPNWILAGNAILYGTGDYQATLASARAGNLPFFALACALVVVWARKDYGAPAALVALLFFATQPTVVGHAGLATTDMAATATIAAALYTFQRWLEQPTGARAALVGLAVGAAVATKFSAIAFVPAAFWPMLALGRPANGKVTAIAAVPVAVVTVLAAYRFHPAAFFAGLSDLYEHSLGWHPVYLFGEVRLEGWWYYLPVALGLKSTIPLLLAFAHGAVRLVRTRSASRAPVAAAAAILVVAMATRMSIGVRHVLPLYPLVAMVAAYGVVHMRRSLAVAFVVAQLASFALAHPDHLAYFNLTAGRDPARLLLDSNLDWGQDIRRLEDAAARYDIDTLHVALFTTAELPRHRLPPTHPLPPFTKVTGWIAISEMQRQDVGARDRPRGAYDWLAAYEPVARVGKSIVLYRVP